MADQYTGTGLMSGSSMDGVDLALCRFEKKGANWHYRILSADTVPYPPQLKLKLEDASEWKMDRISTLDSELGQFFGDQLNDFHAAQSIQPDLIASHGHTILHRPSEGITFQAGSGEIMAEKTGFTVVNDFRRADVEQGGQGAPLVPAGDRLLFGSYGACVNLGGFANISFEDARHRRIAFDICPVNMALNWLAGHEGLEFDANGWLARSGSVDHRLLDRLNNLGFYRADHPKSLGREWFIEVFLPVIDNPRMAVRDRLATLVEHVAVQISESIARTGAECVLLTGGGALNQFLLERLRFHVPGGAEIRVPEDQLVHYKEALVFAFLGVLRLRGEINCYASATGGKRDLSAGVVHLPAGKNVQIPL